MGSECLEIQAGDGTRLGLCVSCVVPKEGPTEATHLDSVMLMRQLDSSPLAIRFMSFECGTAVSLSTQLVEGAVVGRNNDAKDGAVVVEQTHLGCTCKGMGG